MPIDASADWTRMTNQETSNLASFLTRMQPTLESALAKLASTKFREDPIGGAKYSRATSIISSAYKRHGQILGRALLERLKDCGHLNVWTEDNFKLSPASAFELQKALPPESYRRISLPYGEQTQVIPIDLIAHDTKSRTIRSYNVKRGNGSYDAGKRRLIFNELLRTQTLLGGYAKSIGVDVDRAEAFIVFYYGLRSIPEPYSLVANDLDEHFQFPVFIALEAVNRQFRDRLYAMIENAP
jgi:hypothetical protein